MREVGTLEGKRRGKRERLREGERDTWKMEKERGKV